MKLNKESVAKEFNNYFSKIVDSLHLYKIPVGPNRQYTDEIGNIISKFKTCPSIEKMKKHFKIKDNFSLRLTNKDEIVHISN